MLCVFPYLFLGTATTCMAATQRRKYRTPYCSKQVRSGLKKGTQRCIGKESLYIWTAGNLPPGIKEVIHVLQNSRALLVHVLTAILIDGAKVYIPPTTTLEA